LLLRGSTLRATEWCIGTVAYTGADTKLSLNSKRPPSKLSSVDRIVNRTLVVAITTMILVCLISMICYIYWLKYDNTAHYLCLHDDDLSPRFNGNGGGCSMGAPISVLTIFTFATLYNNFVCISMYVSLEMIYLCQSYFVSNDLKMYSEMNDTPAECHTSGMCADLGQIQYILSDKTGTLTKNQMVVQEISLAKNVFGPSLRVAEDEVQAENRSSLVDKQNNAKADPKQVEFEQYLDDSEFYDELGQLSTVGQRNTSGNNAIAVSEKLLFLMLLRVLVYCNTAMIMPDAQGQQEVKTLDELSSRLQAESADEVALILFAAQFGKVLLRKRNNHEIIAMGLAGYYDQSNGGNVATEDERVELLAVNEFDSDRKMMSVIIRIPASTNNLGSKSLKSRYLLLVKGADSSVMKLCNKNEFTPYCFSHVDYFANTGLRTLVCAYRELTEQELNTWLNSYKEASNSISGRSEKMRDCALVIEKNLTLIGAIGIEDELQDGVPESIKMLQSAGLNVWMITGDKAETAIAIGKKCSLIQPAKHDIEKVINLADEALSQRIQELYKYIDMRRKGINPESFMHDKNNATVINPGKYSKHFKLRENCINLFSF
jgi:magnesium-transporting ATPase (P-type)